MQLLLTFELPFVHSLANLLGHSPEWCEPWPRVTAAHNGGFLILEVQICSVEIYFILMSHLLLSIWELTDVFLRIWEISWRGEGDLWSYI